jgi:hypothetical protein
MTENLTGTQDFEESGHVIGIPDRYLRDYSDSITELGPRTTVNLIDSTEGR